MMEILAFLLAAAMVVYLFGAPLALMRRVRRMERQLRAMRTELDAARQPAAPGPPPEAAAADADDVAPEVPAPAVEDATPQAPPAIAVTTPTGDTKAVDAKTPRGAWSGKPGSSATPPAAPAAPSATPSAAAGPTRGVEETLASRWLIWVGAIAVALSAVFLFRYAVDQGWLTPLTRVILGLLLGGALLAAGEWTARNPVRAVRRAVNPDYVPPALSGSGIFAIYAALFAAHGVFGLLNATAAFIALGLVSYSALALSLRQGPFVALLGLIGGYLMPALIDTPDPQAMPLFVYLSALSAGCLSVMVWRKWWWFAFLTLAGALIWPVLWLAESWKISDQAVLASYALGLAVLFALLSTSLPIKRPEAPVWRWFVAVLSDTSGLGFALSGVLLLLVAEAAGFNAAAFTFIGLYGASALVLALRRASLEGLILASVAIAIAAALMWPTPAEVTAITDVEDVVRRGFSLFAVPEQFTVFARALLAFGVLFGLGGFLGALRGGTAVVWAGISSFVPLVFLVIGYWRIGNLETDVSWAAVAGATAILGVLAATVMARRRADRQGEVAMALFAAGATAALALAFTCVLREAWLTVALSLETLALAWIWSKVRVRELRVIAAVVTVAVIVRLVGNPMVLDYEGAVLGLFGWVIYGYGIPAVANWVAARLFSKGGSDAATILCEIAGVGFAFLMVALQLKLWTSGDLHLRDWRLFDQAIQSIWWIVAAGLLLREAQRGKRGWTDPAGQLVLVLSAAAVMALHVVALSPLLTDESVGRFPVVNLLGLAYLVPAGLFLAIAASRRVKASADLRNLMRVGAGVLIFVDVTLETRHAFWGATIGLSTDTAPSNGEFYAYSAVWILFALATLAIGILRRSGPLRYASLAVLMLTVLKVFLFDMSDLTGLYRVASFLGLGLTLIGIGRVYQRFVFGAAPQERGAGAN